MNFFLNVEKGLLAKANCQNIFDRMCFEGKNIVSKESPSGDIFFWIGDFVPPGSSDSIHSYLERLVSNFNLSDLLKVGGYYYVIRYSKHKNSVFIYTSLFNILPIYYLDKNGHVSISSSLKTITEKLQYAAKINKKFILEKLLFNYPFLNDTIYENIKMVPGNHFIKIDKNGLHLVRHTDVSDWFENFPKCTEKKYYELAHFFNERIESYLPDSQYYLSFTGGFDGRTLLSNSLKNKKDIVTYSFGTATFDDVTIPKRQAELLNIKYVPFYLDSAHYLESAYENGIELVKGSGCMANFARAHYVYAAKEISKNSKYIITGNFGSELFRAAHLTGVMISPFLYNLFSSKSLETFIEDYEYPEFLLLNKGQFKNAFSQLKDEIINFGLFSETERPLNERFCQYLYEDIFRKYFGPEIVMQSNFLFNRTPFLDYSFIRELFKTNLAGIYSKFYEQNPVNRFKGQLLYAYLIKENAIPLLHMKTGKGYRPIDLISLHGKGLIAVNYLKKKIKKQSTVSDPFGVHKALELNMDKFMDSDINEDFFDNEQLLKAVKPIGIELNNLISVLSLNWYIQNER